jgi:hypothetical protein
LPIPSPAAAQPPSIALVRTETIMPEVAFVEMSPVHPSQDAKNPPEATNTRASEPHISTAREGRGTAAIAAAPADPLASIMALSEEERLALFI